ncbi:hypothetical protein [Bradyrhizobium diazoefficiens]|uniref:hypothetical protein n=1 Tax=Bradyrhizobium diazoefficiens TaxID=1355477 RepID=UPI00117765B9|nr:hypothetical protein [Bradyrhizobium diazoefficiens]
MAADPPSWYCIRGLQRHEYFGRYGSVQCASVPGKWRASYCRPGAPSFTIQDFELHEAARTAVEEWYKGLMVQ